MLRSITAAASAALLLAAAAGCGDVDDGGDASGKAATAGRGGTLTVFAAASLTETFGALGKAFEASHPGVRVRFAFGGSSTLARQITQGAPADVFAAASPATMKTVTDAGDAAGMPRVFTRNRLVIAVPGNDPGRVRGLGDLARPGLKVVLCAVQVPCGAAAEKALGAAGVEVKPVSREQDVKAVLTKVSLDEADAGLVYRTDAKAAAGKVKGIEFPESARAVNDYPIVEVAKAPRSALAKEFIGLVLGPRGRDALTRAGFEAP
ncbi:molybdate ABC transporter substrate-binding protein [Actinomadura chibensis]|uniref:Molybdate ABC transporter substrate-binding protein n=1 Tax=Actinomadura chibensis TaxID=392828 RepID=A0A5D0NJY2_9ACTN|nr:molybdate ABC transporter substrate-binding protein [Actinomadura chibensis]TYB44786.1 molybdate ABC transporter substrate-binding protein [Actinomadura chibensis]